jgi:hypothetical protein
MQEQTIDDGEIKALLMLLLLKTGTRPDEIQTALRMAKTSRLLEEEHKTAPASAPAPRERSRSAREFIEKLSEPLPTKMATRQIRNESEEPEHPANCTCGRPILREVSPKQVVRNTPLAPMRGYAA